MSSNTYATLKSEFLQKIIAAGFKPLAITVMACEETFLFQTKQEVKDVLNHFSNTEYKNEGWWHSLEDEDSWKETIKEYRKSMKYKEGEHIVYWLNGKIE